MATLSLDLRKKCSEAEMALAQELQVAALTKDMGTVERLLETPTIKRLFKRGVLKTSRTVLSYPGDTDLELG
jgi:hypothetical protein